MLEDQKKTNLQSQNGDRDGEDTILYNQFTPSQETK